MERKITIDLAPGETYEVRASPGSLTVTISQTEPPEPPEPAEWVTTMYGKGCYFQALCDLDLHRGETPQLNQFLISREYPMGRIQKKCEDFSVIVTNCGRLIFAGRGPGAFARRAVGERRDPLVRNEIDKLVRQLLLPGDKWSLEAEKEFLEQVESVPESSHD